MSRIYPLALARPRFGRRGEPSGTMASEPSFLATFIVDTRVREHVIDSQELRVRAGGGAKLLQQPAIPRDKR